MEITVFAKIEINKVHKDAKEKATNYDKEEELKQNARSIKKRSTSNIKARIKNFCDPRKKGT